MVLNVDQVYFFGDSLTDTGNVFNFTGGFFPNPPVYELGRFSNGEVWTDYFAEEFNLTIDPFIDSFNPETFEITFNLDDTNDGINFAIGGATSDSGNVGIVPLGLEQQIDQFEVLVQNQEPSENFGDDLYFLWTGGNDYLSLIENADDPTTIDVIEVEGNFPKNNQDILFDVVNINIGGAIQDIIDAGGKNIVVFNLPNIAEIPIAQGLNDDDREKLRDLIEDHNDRLEDIVEHIEQLNTDVNLIEIDADELFDEILNNPSDFGFTNVTDNFSGIDLYTGGSLPPSMGNPDEYLFVDSVHPSTKAHQLIGDLVMDTLASEGLVI